MVLFLMFILVARAMIYKLALNESPVLRHWLRVYFTLDMSSLG